MKMRIFTLVVACQILMAPAAMMAQSNFSVELGPSYVFNLSYKGDPQKLQNAQGVNLGFNYQLNKMTLLNLQFGYQKFLFEEESYIFAPKAAFVYDILYPIVNGVNISFYNLSLSFRAYFSEKGIRPHINIGSGIHYIKGGVNFNDEGVIIYPDNRIIPSAFESRNYTRFYFMLGPGLSIPVSDKFDIMANGSISVSSELKYLFLPVNLLVKYNF